MTIARVASAKKEETRLRRLNKLIRFCAKNVRIKFIGFLQTFCQMPSSCQIRHTRTTQKAGAFGAGLDSRGELVESG